MAVRSASLCMILLAMALVSSARAVSHKGHSPAPSPHMHKLSPAPSPHKHSPAPPPVVHSSVPSTQAAAPAPASAVAFTPSFLGTTSFACLAALLPIMLSS
ncbi:hypothetical protein BT93_K0557 [Corymbia citriodora subsp. variegata]|nr:hypothetical protein BT93_K0557 [Corymbia citriodora subsp. variegata]